jgi:hypothetical protein
MIDKKQGDRAEEITVTVTASGGSGFFSVRKKKYKLNPSGHETSSPKLTTPKLSSSSPIFPPDADHVLDTEDHVSPPPQMTMPTLSTSSPAYRLVPVELLALQAKSTDPTLSRSSRR